MADLTYIEKETVENFLGMGSGYVMDFTDKTFQKFIKEAVGLDINDKKYHYLTNSKAKRLRKFIEIESNYTFGELLSAFCAYWLSKVRTGEIKPENDKKHLHEECVKIAERLKQESIIKHIDAIQPNADDKYFKLLAKVIKESIDKNEPEVALDRLHTFTFWYLRELCNKHQISYKKTDSLNAVYGKYINFLNDNKYIESEMTKKILKYSINVIEAFNDIRNNKSFSHNNPLLNYHESVLIFNNISNTIKFIKTIEDSMEKTKEPE